MEFASSHVYNYDESDEEEITETDLELNAQESSEYMSLQSGFRQSEVIYDNVGQGFKPPQNQRTEAIYDNTIPQLPPPRVKPKPNRKDNVEYASAYDLVNPQYQYIEGEGSPVQPPPLPPMRKPKRKDQNNKHRLADTNVIAVKFDMLVNPSHVLAGKPVFCNQCEAVFSVLSKITSRSAGSPVWRCEFCDRENPVTPDMHNFPEETDVTYLVNPGTGEGDDTAVIFMVDISGSMSVTTAVPVGVIGEQRLNDAGAALSAYNQEVAAQNGNPTEPKTDNVSYISRLQAMQSAIDQQLSKMEKVKGNKRVGLVAFNDNVIIIGDGTEEPVPLEGAGLTDEQSIISLGQIFPLPAPIREVRRCLSDKVFSLTEGGQTALGPALMISVAMAAQKVGSKVIVCTDGSANVGLGKLDVVDDESYNMSSEFYEHVGHYARDSGICVSVLTMEGEDCRVIELGNVADKTGGQVNVVDPLKLNEEFANILDDPIMATNVSAKLVLHKGMYFRDDENHGEQATFATRNVGIVTKDSETTFEFGVRTKPIREVIYDNFGGLTVTHKDDEAKAKPIYESVTPKSMIEGLDRLPFQLHIWFMGRDGSQNLRVITMDRPITKDRHFAEQNANVGILGAHAAQSVAKLAVEGLYGEARINALVTQKLVGRHAQQQGDGGEDVYQTFVATLAPIQSELYRAHTSARREVRPKPSEDLEDMDDDDPQIYTYFVGDKKSIKRGLTKKAKKRRQKITDKQANLFYKMKNATSKMFQKSHGQMKM